MRSSAPAESVIIDSVKLNRLKAQNRLIRPSSCVKEHPASRGGLSELHLRPCLEAAWTYVPLAPHSAADMVSFGRSHHGCDDVGARGDQSGERPP